MPLNLDGMAVLGAIVANRRLFTGVEPDAEKYARTLVIKQLKAKNADLTALREISRALGRGLFPLLIDAMTDAEVKAVLGKVDKYHPDLKTETPAWRRSHLRALADYHQAAAEVERLIGAPLDSVENSPLQKETGQNNGVLK